MGEDWIIVKLGEFATHEKGKKPKNQKVKKDDIFKFPYVNIEAFEKGIVETYTDGEKCNFCFEDDFLMVWDGSRSGLVGKGMNGALGSTLVRINFPGIVNDYAFYFLSSKYQEINTRAKGSGTPHVDPYLLWNYHFPICSVTEQRAIVSKIETLFSDLDKGIEDLNKAKDQLKIYRQAVLKKAFEGKLTKEWREKQTYLPTAEELLKQIKEERQKHYEQQLENWKQAVKDWEKNGKVGKKPSRTSKPSIHSDPESSDIENYEQLPNSWRWSRFGNVTYKIGDVDHKMPKIVENGLPYLSTGNLRTDGSIDFNNAKIISRTDFDSLALKIKPEKGDIIFPRYGTIGRNILIDFDREFLVSYACAIIKNIKKLMNSKYVLYYSISPVIKKEIKRYVVQTTQANIGIASIEAFVFPLCSTEEQNQIVKEIESRLSVCDQVERSIEESLEKAKALRQSILKKAFEGTLLTKTEIENCKAETDYEPASVLLERIRKEKNKNIKKLK